MKRGTGRQRKRKEATWAKLLLAVVALLQVVCAILLRVLDRKATMKAVKQDAQVKLLYSAEKTTKMLPNGELRP